MSLVGLYFKSTCSCVCTPTDMCTGHMESRAWRPWLPAGAWAERAGSKGDEDHVLNFPSLVLKAPWLKL